VSADRKQCKCRRGFVRTDVPIGERVASFAIVALLVGIGVAIWIKGQQFDPGVYALRAGALKTDDAAAAATQKPELHEATTDEEGSDHGEEAAPSKSSKPATGEPMEIAGFKPMGATEFYSADNLFEKIDGRAGAYLGFNFQALRCRSFEVSQAPGSFVDVYEFRMDNPVNAFGIFALERDPKGKAVSFAPEGYSGELGYYFRQGAYYIQIIASDSQPKTMEAARMLAENRAKSIPEDNTGLEARRRLPVAHLIPESVGFVLENAQGQGFLKNVFQAQYDFEGQKLPFFLMVTTPEAAAAAWKKYNAFCARFGKAEMLPPLNGAQLFRAQSFGKWRVIYQREGEIGGVFDAQDGEKARHFVESYLKGEIQ
jgi:hypothetical protein